MDGTYDPCEETAELILSFGVFFIYYHTYHRLRHSLSSKSNPLTLD
jgi:hypothetical protein